MLGSLPGEASLAAGQYYAHPRNRFWHLIGGVLDRPDLPLLDYALRLALLRERGVGLWDTVRSARRSGSLDTALRAVEPAPVLALAETLPLLRAVAFNGATAARIGAPQLAARPDLACIQLPSSSPAYCAISSETKQDSWQVLRKFLV